MKKIYDKCIWFFGLLQIIIKHLIDIIHGEISIYAPEAKILVVDDVPMNLKVMRGLLKETKIHIDTAISGKECLQLIRRKSYDIIFMDHMMPGLGGIEMIQLMKQIGYHPNQNVPIIMLTENELTEMKEAYLKAGFTDYLSKPIKKKKLIKLLTKYLPKERIQILEPVREYGQEEIL
jgi:CheY-like chemotaxis protein